MEIFQLWIFLVPQDDRYVLLNSWIFLSRSVSWNKDISPFTYNFYHLLLQTAKEIISSEGTSFHTINYWRLFFCWVGVTVYLASQNWKSDWEIRFWSLRKILLKILFLRFHNFSLFAWCVPLILTVGLIGLDVGLEKVLHLKNDKNCKDVDIALGVGNVELNFSIWADLWGLNFTCLSTWPLLWVGQH